MQKGITIDNHQCPGSLHVTGELFIQYFNVFILITFVFLILWQKVRYTIDVYIDY